MSKNFSRRDFLKLASITSAGFALSACGVNATRLTDPMATPSLTPFPTITNTPAPTVTPTPAPLTLREVGEKFNILIGTSVDGGDTDWDTPAYQNAAKKYFSILKAGSFSPQDLVDYPSMSKAWVRLAQEEPHSILYPFDIFSHYSVDPALKEGTPSKEKVINSMKERIRTILTFIKSAGGLGMVDVVAEAMWWSNGPGWENSIYYKTFGRDLITEAYIMTLEEANSLGLAVGKDLHLLYTDYGIEIPSPKSKFVLSELQRTKKEIAQRLSILETDVQLEVGIEFHIITDKKNTAQIGGVFSENLSKQRILDSINMFSEIGPVHIVELQVNYSEDLVQIHDLLDLVIGAAKESNLVRSITLYETLRRANIWHAINSQMFDNNFVPTSFYNKALAILNQ